MPIGPVGAVRAHFRSRMTLRCHGCPVWYKLGSWGDQRRPLDQALSETDFKPSRSRDASLISLRVSAGNQPPGRALPQLVPDGLCPASHLCVSKQILHPVARPATLPEHVERALKAQESTGTDLNTQRLDTLAALKVLEQAYTQDREKVQHVVCSFLQPVTGPRNVALLRELALCATYLTFHCAPTFWWV